MKKVKAKNLILHICNKLCDSERFGSTVLNKVLYYVDNLSYLRTGKPITGLKYIKQYKGPTPNPSEFLPLRNSMVSQDNLILKEVDYFGKIQKKPIALTEPDLSKFSSEEIALIDEVIENFKSFNARKASSYSHNEIAWELAELMEELPYYTFLLTEADLNTDDINWAKKVYASRPVLSNN